MLCGAVFSLYSTGHEKWLPADLAGASLCSDEDSRAFKIVSCPGKQDKDGHVVRRVDVSGPFTCSDNADTEALVKKIRASVAANGHGIPRDKQVVALVNPKAGKSKCVLPQAGTRLP